MERPREALTYRTAAAGDVGVAVELRLRMTQELWSGPPDALDLTWGDRFAHFYLNRMASGSAALFFAESASRVVGMSAVYKLVNHRSEIFCQQSAYISSVYVVPERRRQGIAARLTRMAVEWARLNGCLVARLRTSTMGRPLYLSLGFSQSDEMELLL